MNLLIEDWLKTTRQDGTPCHIAPWQIVETNNPVIDLTAPRLDFQGALYQFLIGLLQTTFAPEDQEDWLAYWEQPPSAEQFQQALTEFQPSFELDSPDGPAFMQDFDLPDGEKKPIAALLIDAPGGKTLKDNLDHFVKGGLVKQLCPSCAATALFTLQTNAPSGGVGHRVGLRGGGPLTTLVIPAEARTLWQRLWANVLTQDDLEGGTPTNVRTVFPWMVETRLSHKGGYQTLRDDVHPLQMYWGMPRRIRLEFEQGESAKCSLCGEHSELVARNFRTKNYGTNYEGPWVHPLTPYRFDPKHEKPPLSLKGQPGGLGYRHWLGLAWQDESNGVTAAQAVRHFNEECSSELQCTSLARLWCFGYDMDNMKARCWYESTMPLVYLDAKRRSSFLENIAQLVDAAKEAVTILRAQVKAAWFSRPKDVKGDMSMVDQTFWQSTEAAFYTHLNQLLQLPDEASRLAPVIAAAWLSHIKQSALTIFDDMALEGNAEDMNMKRITKAKRILKAKLKSAKSLKALKQIETAEKEAV